MNATPYEHSLFTNQTKMPKNVHLLPPSKSSRSRIGFNPVESDESAISTDNLQ